LCCTGYHGNKIFQDSINFNFSVERPKAIRVSPASSSLRRTSSLDTIGPYLQGKWPVDVGSHHHTQSSGTFMADKQTQVSSFKGFVPVFKSKTLV
jgi:hypothetical protein